MSCTLCGRSGSDPCLGCRTLGRLAWLWREQILAPESSQGVTLLRDCAGALTDLSEIGSQRVAQEKAATEGATVREKVAPRPVGERKKVEAPVRAEGGSKPAGAAAEAAPAEAEEEGEEADQESSYSYDTDHFEEPPKKEKKSKESEVKPKEEERQGRGQSLGLKALPSRPSSRVDHKEDREQRGRDRQHHGEAPALPRAGSGGRASSSHRSTGVRPQDRPRSPDHPPPGSHGKRPKERSRSKRKKSKGVKKKERVWNKWPKPYPNATPRWHRR